VTRQASCSCGQLRVDVDGEPIRISVCHCLHCKRRTGSAFAAQARWPHSSAQIRGTSTQWVRTNDQGSTAAFHFPIGAFADPAFPAPSVSVYEERMCSWLAITGDVEHIP
jgi:hypothetical protein